MTDAVVPIDHAEPRGARIVAGSYLNSEGGGLSEWLLTTDHKRIALLYALMITAFFFIGGAAATLIRLELISPHGHFLTDDEYNHVFTLHGIIMVWFFLVPLIPATFGNFLLPLMIGAPDVAFPKLNLASWYLTLIGGICVLAAMMLGGVDTGWTFYPPYSTAFSNSNVAVAVVGVIIAGFGTIATGVNFVATTHMLRAPGMTWFRMPLFVWTIYATSLVMILATPVLAITLALVAADRLFGLAGLRRFPRRRSAALPASFLVLLASRRLHHDPARDGRGDRGHHLLRPASGLRLRDDGLCSAGDRHYRLCGLGPSHVRLGPVGLRQSGLFISLVHRRRAFRHQGLQLDGDALSRADHFRSADALCAGLRRPVHDRRPDRAVPRFGANRRSGDRHLFRRRAFPLRDGRWRRVSLFRWPAFLVAEDHRPALSGIVGALCRRC